MVCCLMLGNDGGGILSSRPSYESLFRERRSAQCCIGPLGYSGIGQICVMALSLRGRTECSPYHIINPDRNIQWT